MMTRVKISNRLVPLGLQETSWVAAPSWLLPADARPQDLWQVPVLTSPPPSPMFRQVMAWFATARLDPAKLNVCSSVTTIGQLIAAGIGIAVMPVKVVAPYIAAGTVVPLTTTPPIEAGRLFVSYGAGVPRRAIQAAVRVLNQVLQAIDYLAPAVG